jgi:hypothetical protein
MSRIVFKLNTDNTIQVLDTDFAEEYIDIKTDGSSKIITISVVDQDYETSNEEEYI